MKRHIRIVIISGLYLFSFLILLGIYLIGQFKENIPYEAMTGDPANFYNFHPLTGILSHIGILMWSATATVCLYTGILLLKLGSGKLVSRFYLYAGVLTAFLLIDDLFMIHDLLFRQLPVYALYFLMMGFLLYKFHKIILSGPYFIFGASLCFFAVSIGMDLLLPNMGLEYFLEDGFKFLGIVSWAIFFINGSYDSLLSIRTAGD